MGFLDNLFGKETQKAISNALGSVISEVNDLVNDVTDAVNQQTNGTAASNQSNGRSVQNQPVSPVRKKSLTERELRSRLEKIFSEEWSSYEVRKDIPSSEFNAGEGARPYSYGLYLDGQPKALFMILTNRNHYKLSAVVKSQKASQEQNIPYMNFMTYLPNDIDYISQRLRSNIK